MLKINEGLFHRYFDIPDIWVIFIGEDKFNFIGEINKIVLDFFDMFIHELFIVAFDIEPNLVSLLQFEFFQEFQLFFDVSLEIKLRFWLSGFWLMITMFFVFVMMFVMLSVVMLMMVMMTLMLFTFV